MSKKIRILQSIRQGLVGGGETHVFDLSTNLDADLFEPVVLSFTEGPMVDKLRKSGIETYVIPTVFPFDPRVSSAIKKLLVEKRIDMVHAHGTRAASNTISICRKLKLPFIYTVHGWSFNDSQSKFTKQLRILAEKYITKRSDKVICVSESNRQTGESEIKNFKAEVINNGISFEKFNNNWNREAARVKLGFKDNELWIGFIARLTFQKNPLLLLRAFEEAYRQNDQLRLLMIGEGDLEDEAEELITSLGLKKVVKRMPFQDNVPEILSAIDIYSLVSLWEGLPIGLIEAMAMKKAIIASAVDGTKEIIFNGENGLLIPSGDQCKFATAILRYAENPELIDLYGDKAYKLASSKFALKDMVEKNQTIYKQLTHPK